MVACSPVFGLCSHNTWKQNRSEQVTGMDTVGEITFLAHTGKDRVSLTTFSHGPHYVEGGSLRIIPNVGQNKQTRPEDQEKNIKVREQQQNNTTTTTQQQQQY